MIVLILGTAMVAGVAIGSYGHKASSRVAAWGRGLDEQDLIFQEMSEGGGGGEMRSARDRRIEDPALGAILGNSHYPATATGIEVALVHMVGLGGQDGGHTC